MYKLLPIFTSPTGFTTEPNQVLRVTDNAYVPFDPDNTDYQAYLKFLADGGQPLPADEVA
jgi:hypothetical protein